MGIVVEEANETVYWLELLLDSQTSSAEEVAGLLREANELLRIFGASLRTLRERAKSAGANG
jgi:four helix bundle protein